MAVAAGGGNRIQTNNYVALESGAYNGTIVDEWVHFVTKEPSGVGTDGRPKFRSKYSRTPTDDQEIKISVQLDDDASIVLERRMAFYATKNSAYGKMVASLTGFEIGSDAMKNFDSKALRGMKCLVDVKLAGTEEKPYTRVNEIRARPKSLQAAARGNGSPSAGERQDEGLTDRQRAQIKLEAGGREIALDSERFKEMVFMASGARTENPAKLTPSEADVLIAALARLPLPTAAQQTASPTETRAEPAQTATAAKPDVEPRPIGAGGSIGGGLSDNVVKNMERAFERAGVDADAAAELIGQVSLDVDGETTYDVRRLSIGAVNALLQSLSRKKNG